MRFPPSKARLKVMPAFSARPGLEVQVFGQRELERRLARAGPVLSHLVSITDPREPEFPEAFQRPFRRSLLLRFSDCASDEAIDLRCAPELEDARKVLAFVEETAAEAGGYTVHCFSGISRSTAVALAILYLSRGSEDEAARELIRIRHIAHPHPGLVSFFDAILGSRLASVAEAMRDERLKVMRERARSAAGRAAD